MRIRVYPQYNSFGGYGSSGYYGGAGYGYGGARVRIRPVGGWGAAARPLTNGQIMRAERQAERYAKRSVRGMRQAMRQAELEAARIRAAAMPVLPYGMPISPFGMPMVMPFAPAFGAMYGQRILF